MANGAAPATTLPPSLRVRPWKRISVILFVLLAACLVVIAGLAITRTVSVTRTGIDWYHLDSENQSYYFDSEELFPAPAVCVTSTTFSCTDRWVALNWSASDGHNLTFQFYSCYSFSCPGFLMYSSKNTSFGGYSFWCGPEPRYCGEPFGIRTNDTSGRLWTFQWETLFNYTATTNTPIL